MSDLGFFGGVYLYSNSTYNTDDLKNSQRLGNPEDIGSEDKKLQKEILEYNKNFDYKLLDNVRVSEEVTRKGIIESLSEIAFNSNKKLERDPLRVQKNELVGKAIEMQNMQAVGNPENKSSSERIAEVKEKLYDLQKDNINLFSFSTVI